MAKNLKLKKKISPNDVIFHFAGVNRDINDNVVFDKNNSLNEILLSALIENAFSNSKDLTTKCSTGLLINPNTREILLEFIFLTLKVTMFKALASERDLTFE